MPRAFVTGGTGFVGLNLVKLVGGKAPPPVPAPMLKTLGQINEWFYRAAPLRRMVEDTHRWLQTAGLS